MANYSCLIAQQLGLPDEEQKLILHAAPMHDVGKIGIPDQILLKPGPLTAEEFATMKTHTTIGFELLKGSVSMILQAATTIAVSHHEKYDGSGYPYGLAGDAIPLYGRIVAVADVFDALTSERPYKKAWSLERAADFLREGRGRHFDPDCLDAFLARWPEAMSVHSRFQDAVVPSL